MKQHNDNRSWRPAAKPDRPPPASALLLSQFAAFCLLSQPRGSAFDPTTLTLPAVVLPMNPENIQHSTFNCQP
jgi:hypothetical protein